MKKHSESTDRFDQSTFFGRFQHFVFITSPLSLIHSDSEVQQSKQILDEYTRNPFSTNYSNDQLWDHRYLCKAAINPGTGEVIPKWFRVSAIAPVNIPIVYGMITCPPSNVPGTLALHFINQSYNTACNYCNRLRSSVTYKIERLREMIFPFTTQVWRRVKHNGASEGLYPSGRFCMWTCLWFRSARSKRSTSDQEIWNFDTSCCHCRG